jgi:hypothetical protein
MGAGSAWWRMKPWGVRKSSIEGSERCSYGEERSEMGIRGVEGVTRWLIRGGEFLFFA